MEVSDRTSSFPGFFTGISLSAGSVVMLLSAKGSKRYLILPFVINLLVLAALVSISIIVVYPAAASLLPSGDHWYLTVVRAVLTPVIILGIGAVLFLSYSLIGGIIAIPFAEALVSHLGVPIAPAGILDSLRLLRQGIAFLLLFIAAEALLSLFNIIPGIGSILYMTVSFFLLIFFLGTQLFCATSPAFLPLSVRLKETWSLRGSLAGIGLSFLFFSSIPLVGFLSPIIGYAAAARLRLALSSGNGVHGA